MRFPAFLPRLRPVVWAVCICFLLTPLSALAGFTEQGATILRDSTGALIPGGANYSARSASLADIDNDGDLDLYFQGGTASGVPVARQLFRNNTINVGGTASNTFTNVTTTWLPSTLTDSWSAAWGDYDGDGKVDIFLGQTNDDSSPPYTVNGRLLRNTGSSFVDVSTTTGFSADHGFAQNVGWADINNDHRLDMLIGMEGPTTKNQIYLQDASHVFTPVTAAVGFQQNYGTKAYGMAIGDTDGDGDLDVFISTCIGGGNIRNNFYKNMLKETGSLSFQDIADSNGTQDLGNTYGTEFVDFDNDGKLDLYVTGAQNDVTGVSNLTKIYKNMGNNQFSLVATFSAGTDLNGSKAIDYDNDGKLDLFFHDNLNSTSSGGNVRLFHNDGNWTFTDVTVAQGLTNPGVGGYDSVWGDIDRDGDQDLINPNNKYASDGTTLVPERIYINNASTNGNHWLYVTLKGPDWDTTGIGSTLYATLNAGTPQEVTLRREANTNPDTFNQSDLPVHFGMGSSLFINHLLVRWADGTAQVLNTILGDRYITITYFPGDYNGDNVVDNRDYLVWRKGLGGEFTQDDYMVWRTHFGAKFVAGDGAVEGGAIPEPTSLVLLLSAMPLLFVRRRK